MDNKKLYKFNKARKKKSTFFFSMRFGLEWNIEFTFDIGKIAFSKMNAQLTHKYVINKESKLKINRKGNSLHKK